MDATHKKTLKGIILEIRHLLEGRYDAQNNWQPGDLERRLAAMGVRRDRKPLPMDEIPHLSELDKRAREVVDAYLSLRIEAGIDLSEAVAEFVRETAYSWANRLLALRCMEARELIDEVILQKPVYGGRSLEHHRLAQRRPESCSGEDDGLFAVLDQVFEERAGTLSLLFDPRAPGVALKPTPSALMRCVRLLSGTEHVNGQTSASDDVFKAPDTLGWAYQYWNTEEKDRVFEKVRTQKGAKIQGADIIPATQLYTEPYMVKFLVQNSLGATWVGMQPDTQLMEGWEYFVRDADRAPVEKKPVQAITFLDPACGSGHFLIEAFDLFYAMYEEEGHLTEPEAICRSILEKNLFGIDIDERAVQIAEAALWMKAAEKAFEFGGAAKNLVATNIRLPKGKDHLEEFLKKHPEDKPIRPALEVIFEGLAHADELGSLLQIEEPVEREFKHLKETDDRARSQGMAQGDLFRPTAVQDQLPFGIESYDAWRKKTVVALKEHFAAEAESADLGQAFFGQSVGKGLALFGLLARRYDVVATNPPYMGSGNMGDNLSRYLERQYRDGKRDLYAGFIIRGRLLVRRNGFVGMITLQSWLTKDSYEHLRERILFDNILSAVVLLNRYAFSEADPPGFPVLFTLQIFQPPPETSVWALQIVPELRPPGQEAILGDKINNCRPKEQLRLPQLQFAELPKHQILVGMSPQLLSILTNKKPLSSTVRFCEPSTTGDNTRFVRYVWECLDLKRARWHLMSKGGSHKRWSGLEIYLLDWEYSGRRIKEHRGSYIRNEAYMFKPGITLTAMSRHGISFRNMPSKMTFGKAGPGCFPSVKDIISLILLLNSRLYQYLLRSLNPDASISTGNIARLPVPSEDFLPGVEEIAKLRLEIANRLSSFEILESSFQPSQIIRNLRNRKNQGNGLLISRINCLIVEQLKLECLALLFDSAADILVEQHFCLNEASFKNLDAKFGNTATNFEALPKYDNIPVFFIELTKGVSDKIKLAKPIPNIQLSSSEIDVLKGELRRLFEGHGQTSLQEINENEKFETTEEAPVEKNEKPGIPSESTIHHLSKSLNLHPVTVFEILKEGIETKNWQSKIFINDFIHRIFTVTVLEILGHRWPKQIEVKKSIPKWADKDGIIPLTGGTNEEILLNRVRERIAAEFEGGDVASTEREFAEIIGKSLEQWVETEFFKHHVKQFKKRPIAWQIQSEKYARNNKPAFACLIYYHKLDGDLLPKIRTQYVGLLRQRCETELRGIEALPLDARSDRQEKRRIELETQIEELKHFDVKLNDLTESTFGPHRMIPHLRQNALEDSMLCLKTQWLKKLSGIMQQDPLKGWITLAEQAEVHAKLPEWIMEPVHNLHYFCSNVGAHTPKEKTFKEDPGAGELAEIICSRAEDMVKGSLRLVCTSWWKNLDGAVFTPLRKQIRDLQNELKLLKEKEAVEGKDNPRLIFDFEMRIESLKMEMKALRKALADKTEKAKRIRDEIESWSNTDALTWEPWLATQHMYDAISGIDSQHNPPGSIQDFIQQESAYLPDINDGVRVNIAPLQKAGVLAGDVLAKKDLNKAISDRAEWRADERRWCREGKLPQPGWWPTAVQNNP